MTPQGWQSLAAVIAAFAALMGGLYAIVTRPLLKLFSSIQEEMRGGFSEVNGRLARIEAKLDDHEKRITTLEAQRWR